MTQNRRPCVICNKKTATYSCGGCDEEFCFPHLQEHRQGLDKQLDEIVNDHDQFRQTINERKQILSSCSLFKEVDRWEQTSMEIIRRTAQDCRQTLMKDTERAAEHIDSKFDQFAGQLKTLREENQFNEIDLEQLNNNFTEIKREFTDRPKISIERGSQPLINKINVATLIEFNYPKWKQDATTIAGGNGKGEEVNQLNLPVGIAVNPNQQEVLIADVRNDRIVQWKWQATSGTIVAGGNGPGNRLDQLHGPTDVIVDKHNRCLIIADRKNKRVIQWYGESAMKQQILVDNIHCWCLAIDNEGSLYVSDWKNNEVRRWKRGERQGTLVAGSNGCGDELNQLCHPSSLFVDDEQSIYVSEDKNNRVIKWQKEAKEGVIVAGGNGRGNNRNQLSNPQGVRVDRWGYIYVVDQGNDRIMRWREGEKQGEIVAGGNGRGNQSNQFSCPTGLSFDDEGNLYVVDSYNRRVQKFDVLVN